MSIKTTTLVSSVLLTLALATPGHATVLAYDSLSTAVTSGLSRLDTEGTVFGDSLTLAQAGQLESIGLTLFNSGSSAGPIVTGNMVVNFYDNTTPYAGGALSLPLLGTATLTWDFSGDGGLPAGYFTTGTFDLTALNISLTKEVLVTQQFTLTSGTATRTGIVLFSDPTTGSSPNTIYLKSSASAEGLYTITDNPGQIGYGITLVPEPATIGLLTLGALAMFRRRK